MDKLHYDEMENNLNKLIADNILLHKRIYLFGHCNATEVLADLLLDRGFSVDAILDNNMSKHGNFYREIPICPPEIIVKRNVENAIVCIVARAYAAMAQQLNKMGYKGMIRKLVDYNSFSEYSFSEDTLLRMTKRVERGKVILNCLEEKHPRSFRIFCPFSALGDIFIMMSYLPHFLKKRNVNKCVICVVGNVCAQVVSLYKGSTLDDGDILYGEYSVEVYSQKDMDEMIQAALYTEDKHFFIAHQDRPYVVNLQKALYIKCIPLEQIYCCGVFGLPIGTEPYKPVHLKKYKDLDLIKENNAVIFSPYAKSVTTFNELFWKPIVDDYLSRGFQCFTNVVGDEKFLDGTLPISPSILEIQSVVEKAGHFVGIRSGLCDVIRYADCEKIALYPDYYYSDTKWKAIDMYALKGWKNIVVGEDFEWKN